MDVTLQKLEVYMHFEMLQQRALLLYFWGTKTHVFFTFFPNERKKTTLDFVFQKMANFLHFSGTIYQT